MEAVEESGLVHAGSGRNFAEASAPRFLETENGRVALIAVNSSFAPPCMAGEQTKRVPGRPGINGLRLNERFEATEEEFLFILQLYNVEFTPMEFYEKYSLTPENTVYELLKKRSLWRNNDKRRRHLRM